jgi:diguanylate cyclase
MDNLDRDYTNKMADEAMERIKALQLPADPNAFALWYDYVAGSNEQLNRRLNRIIEDTGGLSAAEQGQICDEFLSSVRTNTVLENAGTKVSAEIDNIVGMLSDLILTTSRGREDCADASSQLAYATDRQAVRAISDALIRSLRAIELQQRALEQRLVASKQEIEAVQQSLARTSIEANTDPVTSLANRRGFGNALRNAVEQADKLGRPLSLMMIDIDHFKNFNDRFGHLMGDSVLRLIGVVLRQNLKGQDTAARYGGEEFAVILPGTDLASAVALAEQLRDKVMNRDLKRRSSGEKLGAITVSIGAAAYRHGEQATGMVDRADASLYEAKRAGRNCTRWQA